MNPAPIFRRCSVLLVLAMAGVGGASARAVELTSNSPFLPPNSNADASATPANSPLELHGILDTPDGYKFNLCDPSGHINVWVGLNAAGPFVVRTHDVSHYRVTVDYQGRELTLALVQPKITPMAMQQQMMPMPQPMMQPGGVANPADESQRLQRIAEEIRRRRALRAGMQSQQFPPGVNRPGMSPQPPQQ